MSPPALQPPWPLQTQGFSHHALAPVLCRADLLAHDQMEILGSSSCCAPADSERCCQTCQSRVKQGHFIAQSDRSSASLFLKQSVSLFQPHMPSAQCSVGTQNQSMHSGIPLCSQCVLSRETWHRTVGQGGTSKGNMFFLLHSSHSSRLMQNSD